MSTKKFTDQEIETLRKNPYVYSVTPSRLTLTKEFKELFIEQYGTVSTNEIFQSHGLSIDLIGKGRAYGISYHIRKEYDTYGEFHEGYRHPKSGENSPAVDNSKLEESELKQLKQEVEYLKQQMEFLKKISSVRNTRK